MKKQSNELTFLLVNPPLKNIKSVCKSQALQALGILHTMLVNLQYQKNKFTKLQGSGFNGTMFGVNLVCKKMHFQYNLGVPQTDE